MTPIRAVPWILAGLVALSAACERAAQEPRPVEPERTPVIESRPRAEFNKKVKIASIFPTLGRYAISGEESHRGVRLAEEEALSAGPIHGREIEILYYRTGSDPIDVERAARDAEQAGALAIVGCNASVLSEAIRSVAQIRGIPMVSNVSTVPGLTWDRERDRNYEFVFRVCHSDEAMAEFLAQFARKDLGASRAAILFDESRSYSKNLAAGFRAHFAGDGVLEEIRSFFYAAYETDFRAQLMAIRQFDPDVLFVPASFTDASLIAVQAEDLGVQATLLGGDSWSNRLLFSRGGPADACYHGDHWFEEGPFLETYVARYGFEPDGGRAALAHDATGILVTALRNLGPLTDSEINPSRARLSRTRDRLRRAIARVYYEGVTGDVLFDEHGDPPQKGVIVKIENGERTLVKRFAP